jgi:predicted transcriptional regulator
MRAAAPFFSGEPSAFGMPVVDDHDRFVGILPRATAALAVISGDAAAVATAIVSGAYIHERATLHDAFRTMTERHARELTVVDDAREVTGTLRDVDALRFVSYVSRTGLRPMGAA